MSILSIIQARNKFLNSIISGGNTSPNGGIVFVPKLTIPNVTPTPRTVLEASTGVPTSTTVETGTTPFIERVQVLERIRNSSDLDPSAKSRILLLAASRPELNAQDLRTILGVCLYPSAQGLPAPEGYEYFLTKIEKGATVAAALSDARIYFKADAALTGDAGDPNAPDSQETLLTQGRVVTLALIVFAFLIIRQ